MPQVHDYGKLGLIALIIIGIFAALLTDHIEFEQALPLMTGITGYLFGNGVVAIRGRAASPMIVPKIGEGDVATTTGTVDAAELRQYSSDTATDAGGGGGGGESAWTESAWTERRPGEHTTGEHFVRPWPPPRPEETPPSWQTPIPPAPGYVEPEGARYSARHPGDVGEPDTGGVRYPGEVTEHERMCRCGHPRLHHVESETYPGTFLWCATTSPAIDAGVFEARCACNVFAPPDTADNAQFWARAEEERHGPP